jgi:prevent-host-death family protein
MSKDNARAISDILSKKDTDIIDGHLTIGSREARIRFGKIVENAKREQNQFVITEHGEPAAALIPISDLRILDWLKRQHLKDHVSNAVFSDMSLTDFKALLESGGTDDDEDHGMPRQTRGAA